MRDIARYYWRGARGYRAFTIGGLLFVVGTEVVNVIIPIFYKDFFDGLSGASDAVALFHIIWLILALNLLWLFLRQMSFVVVIHGDGHIIPRLKQGAFASLMAHSHSFFSNVFAGSMVSRVQRYASGYERLLDTFYQNLLPLTINVGGAVIVIYTQEPILAWVVGLWALIFLYINYVFSKWRFKYNIEHSALDSLSTGYLADSISNYSAVQSFDAFSVEEARYRDATERQGAAQRFLWYTGTIMDTIQFLFVVLVEFAVFYVTLGLWIDGTASIGLFVLLQVFVLQIGSKLTNFGRVVRTLYEVHAQSAEMVEIMEQVPDIRDAPSATPLVVSRAEVVFDHAQFAFNETRNAVQDVSFTIPGGQKVALVGPSGAGKTTIVRLLMRLFDVSDGQVLIDGQNVRTATLSSLRSAIAFVPQDPALFHRTLLENIRYGRPSATDAEVIEAAKRAHCHEFIVSLPQGYDTLVGERGVKLSGGERQRVAIARAILKNAPILVLDEATSSLDSESESLIQEALDELMKGKTVIVIAHRLSTIRKMDRILVVKGGQIVEDGTHSELLQNEASLYKQLWELQAGGFIVEKDEN